MRPLLDHFLEAAAANSAKPAIRDNNNSISYEQLAYQVDQLATWLLQNPVGKGDRVGIHLVNSIEYVIAYYACWRAGLVPVALNTLASPAELAFWLSDSGCKLLFSQRFTPESTELPVISVKYQENRVLLDDAAIDRLETRTGFPGLEPQDVATIIYTSGTTGNPKGITLSQRNLSANMGAIIKSLAITSEDRFLCVLPFFYSFGNSILHTHLMAGATLVLLNQVAFPVEILKSIQNHRCNGFAGVPSLYISLLRNTRVEQYDLSTLRYLTQAGGPLPKEFIAQLHQRLADVDLYIMYGQTEATARISYLEPNCLEARLGSVGKALDGVDITIRDSQDNECAAGETGEICVAGDNIMSGYWNNPAATAGVIVENRLRTGDMGYKDEDGFLYIVGRQSEILKISDHRVSPYEIEEVLLMHPAVEECAVIGCSHQQMGQYARAFVVSSGDQVEVTQLKKHCKQSLASYKIPKEILFVEDLPKTSSGKVKRDQLPC